MVHLFEELENQDPESESLQHLLYKIEMGMRIV